MGPGPSHGVGPGPTQTDPRCLRSLKSAPLPASPAMDHQDHSPSIPLDHGPLAPLDHHGPSVPLSARRSIRIRGRSPPPTGRLPNGGVLGNHRGLEGSTSWSPGPRVAPRATREPTKAAQKFGEMSRKLRIAAWLNKAKESSPTQECSFVTVEEGIETTPPPPSLHHDNHCQPKPFSRRRTGRVSQMNQRRRQWRSGGERRERDISPASETSHGDSEEVLTLDKRLLDMSQTWSAQAIREHRINALRSFLTSKNQPLKVLQLLESSKVAEAVTVARESKKRAQLDVCLLWACLAAAPDLVQSLVAAGASVEAEDTAGFGCLHLAAESGSEEVIHVLVNAGVRVGGSGDWDNCEEVTPLMLAARSGCVGGIMALLDAGAEVDAGLATGKDTALHYAIKADQPECVQVLLGRGATVNPSTLYSESPLHAAAYEGLSDVVSILLEAGGNVTAARGTTKMTALHIAASEGYFNISYQLLKAGSNPNQENLMGQTPLHLAAKSQSYDTVQVLLSFRANPNARDRDMKTPLHFGIFKGSRSHECLKLLLEAGATTNAADLAGYTPLHMAALHDSSYCVLLFLDHGGDVTARTQGGVSALNLILRRTPAVLAHIQENLDAAISFADHDHHDRDAQVQIDFRVLVPGDTVGMETRMLSCFMREGQKVLLKHPVCETFLFLKWTRIRAFFIFNLVFSGLLVAMLTCYIMVVFPTISCIHQAANASTLQDLGSNLVQCGIHHHHLEECGLKLEQLIECGIQHMLLEEECGLQHERLIKCGLHHPTLLTLLLYAVWMGLGWLALKEIFQILDTPRTYFSSWDNVLVWPIIVFSLTITITSFARHDTATWEHHVAAIVILLTWAELLLIIGRFPLFGIYIQMFTHVTKNFGKFLFAYICLISAFSMSFGVLFPTHSPFKHYGIRLIKTMVMMTGEIEYDQLFFDEDIMYPITSHLVFAVFLIFVTIILMNLLVGLAVSDIQRLQKSAGLDLLVRQTELMAHFEAIMYSTWLSWVLPSKFLAFLHQRISICPSLYGWTHVLTPKSQLETGLPQDLVDVVVRTAKARDHANRRRNAFSNFRTMSKTAQYSSDSDGDFHSSLDALRFGLDLLVWDADERKEDNAYLKDDLIIVKEKLHALTQAVTALASKDECKGVACSAHSDATKEDETTSVYTLCESPDTCVAQSSVSSTHQGTISRGNTPPIAQATAFRNTTPSIPRDTASRNTTPSIPRDTASRNTTPSITQDTASWGTTPSIPYDTASRNTTPSIPRDTTSRNTTPSISQDTASWGTMPSMPYDTASRGTTPSQEMPIMYTTLTLSQEETRSSSHHLHDGTFL